MKINKLLLTSALLSLTLVGCTRVEPNEAGVLMQHSGKNGKEDFSLVSGRVFVAPITEQLYRVPMWEQRGSFDGAVSLKASDNTEFRALPIYSFSVTREGAVDFVFENKHLTSAEDFSVAVQDNILEPKIFDIMKEESRKFTTEELMAKGGSLAFEDALQKRINEVFKEKGLKLNTFSAQLEFSNAVTERIDKRNEVNQNIAVIDQQILEEQKKLELAKIKAETNKTLSEGITKEILAQQFIEKWDGKTPLYGETPVSILKPSN